MTSEEAIRVFQYGAWWHDYADYRPETKKSDEYKDELLDAIDVAISALRAQQEVAKNEPLTMEELEKMNGQPVWLDNYPNGWKCFIVNLELPTEYGKGFEPCGIDLWGNGTSLSLLVECGLYRHPPKEDTNV